MFSKQEYRRWFDEGAIAILAICCAFVFITLLASFPRNKSSFEEYIKKCEQNGGVMTQYQFHRSPTQYVCLKKDSVIEIK